MLIFTLKPIACDDQPSDDGQLESGSSFAGVECAVMTAIHAELRPGRHFAVHSGSVEEAVYVIAGVVEVNAVGEQAVLHAGDLALIPAPVWYCVRNTGAETAQVLRFFPQPNAGRSKLMSECLPVLGYSAEAGPLKNRP